MAQLRNNETRNIFDSRPKKISEEMNLFKNEFIICVIYQCRGFSEFTFKLKTSWFYIFIARKDSNSTERQPVFRAIVCASTVLCESERPLIIDKMHEKWHRIRLEQLIVWEINHWAHTDILTNCIGLLNLRFYQIIISLYDNFFM